MFQDIDFDKSKRLDMLEMEKIVNLVSPPFDADSYMAWYDSNGGKSDGSFDRREFGWYIVDCAENDATKMPEWIAKFQEACKIIVQRQGVKNMDDIRRGK